MKGRESGMPDEEMWRSFYDADGIIARLDCVRAGTESIVEFGGGYGTFTFPAARRTAGLVHTFDIEPELVALLHRRAQESGLVNVRAAVRDFVAHGTGLPDASVDHAMVFNLLHLENPVGLLQEAFRVLKPGGLVSIIHWKYDPATPRGPSMSIRPKPGQCRRWAEAAGFRFVRNEDLSSCCPYHYGLLLVRPAADAPAPSIPQVG